MHIRIVLAAYTFHSNSTVRYQRLGLYNQ